MKILLIEDSSFWQKNVQNILEEINLPVATVVSSNNDAKNYLSNYTPDLIISDIVINNELAFEIFISSKLMNIPTIFITSSDDHKLYEKKPPLSKSLYMIKPIQPLSLKSAIEILLPDFNKNPINESKTIIVRGKYNEKIPLQLSDIICIRAEKNYCILKTQKVQFMVRNSLLKLLDELGSDFIQIHRAYIVNKSKIIEINLRKNILLTTICELPIGLTYKPQIFQVIKERYDLQ
jgi:DNA-binding LytR/AlgR family response regulator